MNQEIQNESRWCESQWIKREWCELCSVLRSSLTVPSSSGKAETRGVSRWGAERTVLLEMGQPLTARLTRRSPWTGLSTDNGQKHPSYQPWSLWRISTIQASAGSTTQHWEGSPGAFYTVPVVISSRECWRAQLGVTVCLSCQWWTWSQYQPGLIFCHCNCIQDLEEGWEGNDRVMTLDFRRRNFSLLRELLNKIPWDATMRWKRAQKTWMIFKEILLRAQQKPILLCRKTEFWQKTWLATGASSWWNQMQKGSMQEMDMRNSTRFLKEVANVIVRLLSTVCDNCSDWGSPRWLEKV